MSEADGMFSRRKGKMIDDKEDPKVITEEALMRAAWHEAEEGGNRRLGMRAAMPELAEQMDKEAEAENPPDVLCLMRGGSYNERGDLRRTGRCVFTKGHGGPGGVGGHSWE